MKKLFLAMALLLGVIATSCSDNKKVIIEIPEMSDAQVYVIYQDPDMINARTQEEVAKTEIKDGKCELDFDTLNFDGKRKECTVTLINQDKQFGANLPLIIEKGKTVKLKISGVSDYLAQKSILNVSYSGSKFAEAFSDFWKQVNDSFEELVRSNNDVKVYKKQTDIFKNFIKKYPDSGYPYSMLIGEMQMIPEEDNPIVKYCSDLTETQNDNPWHKYLADAYKYRQMKRATASTLVLSAQDIDGKQYTERDFKGKLILVDFWASWCKPCIESIPKLQKIYDKYKDKGLTVVSVSVDTNPNDWAAYVEKNPFVWTSLIGHGREITERYDFQYIPYVLLADSEGKILRQGIEIEKLEGFIEEYLNK